MDQASIPRPVHQRRFRYAEDETWRQLSEPAQQESVGLLAQILRIVTVQEQQTQRVHHEREDSN